jgi:hypothetical protein
MALCYGVAGGAPLLWTVADVHDKTFKGQERATDDEQLRLSDVHAAHRAVANCQEGGLSPVRCLLLALIRMEGSLLLVIKTCRRGA